MVAMKIGKRGLVGILHVIVIQFVTLLTILLNVSVSYAVLDPPLRGRALNAELDSMQLQRVMKFWEIKGHVLNTARATQEIDQVENLHEIVNMALDVDSLIDNVGQMAKLGSGAISKYREAGKLWYFEAENAKYVANRELAEMLFVYVATMSSLIDDSALQEFSNSLPTASARDIASRFTNFIQESPSGQTLLAVALDMLSSVDPNTLSEAYNMSDYSWTGSNFKSALKSVANAKFELGPKYFITKGIGIANDLYGAYLAATIDRQLKSRLIAMEFLDYYFVTYGGNYEHFSNDIGAAGANRIYQLFDAFMNQKNEVGQTMRDYYGAVDWVDVVLCAKVDKTVAVSLIREVLSKTGTLGLKFSYQGGSDSKVVSLGDKTQIKLELDPMLALDYTFNGAAVTETLPNGNTVNHSTPAGGGLLPIVTSVAGMHLFNGSYGLVDRDTGASVAYNIGFSDEFYLFSNYASVAPLTINGLTVAKSGTEYYLNISATLPNNLLSYSRSESSTSNQISGFLPIAGDSTVLVRVKDKYTGKYIPWRKTANNAVELSVPVSYRDALMAKTGKLGDYTFEIEVYHPQMLGAREHEYDKSFSYSDLTQPYIDVPYLEIKASLSIRANSLGPDYLRLAEGDIMKLYPRNVIGWPDFSGLTGSVKVIVLDPDYEDHTLTGILLPDGGVQVTIPAGLPDNYYKILSIFSLDGEAKHIVDPFSTYQLLELDSIETVTIPPSIGSGLLQWGSWSLPAGTGADYIKIAAGKSHSLAVKSDRTVVAWGDNTYGQSNVPEGLSGVDKVAAGAIHSLALKTDGTVVAWGASYEVAGYTGLVNVPEGLTGVNDIAAANNMSIVLKNDRTVVAWGYGASVPAGLSEVIKIAAGDRHVLALKSDGTVVAWGDNSYGEGTVPTGLSGVVEIAAGAGHSLALKGDGTVVAWGDNSYGQSTVPEGLSGVEKVAAGAGHSLAQKSDGTVVAWGKNDYLQTIVPLGLNGVTEISARENINFVRAGSIPDRIELPVPTVTLLSENIPDGSYQVGPATKVWRFKTGRSTITNLHAERTSEDLNLNSYSNGNISIGTILPNSEFLVSLPINPSHSLTDLKSSNWKFVYGSGSDIPITNSTSGQFWVKVKTNRPPVVSQLQLNSVAGKEGQLVCLPILISDPDRDALAYSVVSGGGNVSSYTITYDKQGYQYCNTFAAGLHAVTVVADDGHGSSAKTTFQAVITSNSSLKDFYNDVTYANATTQALKDQYAAIHYLTLYGITIGTPVDPNDPSNLARIFKPNDIANQAEALGMIMKTASVRGVLDLDIEPRWLPNLIKEDAANGVYYNFSWALPYALKAEALGMIPSAEAFEPSKPVTREWLAMMVNRMMALNTPQDVVNPENYLFADAADFTSTEAYDAARASAFFGYMKGQLGSSVIFNPLDAMIRADVAVVAAKVLRTPSIGGLITNELAYHTIAGKSLPSLTHGQSLNVNGVQNLLARRMLGDGTGNLQEDPVFTAEDYTTATIIQPGIGIVASGPVKNLATSPLTVPTNPPDISSSETRSLLVILESLDDSGSNAVRSIYRMEYGVIFPDADGDGVRDSVDLWPYHRHYSVDANGNGIPDNADSLWGLTSRLGSDLVSINGQGMQLVHAVTGDYLANDSTPPTTSSYCSEDGAFCSDQPFLGPQTVYPKPNETAVVRCTTDGSIPSDNSPICESVYIDRTTTIKYFATDLVGNREAVKTANYVITPINGTCSISNGNTFYQAPTSNLCIYNNASQVTGTGPWYWTCEGLYGGTTAQCSANIYTYTVTVNAGTGGSVPGSSQFTVNYGSAGSVTIAPDNGYQVESATGCDGTLSGNVYTTGPIYSSCTVEVTFAAMPQLYRIPLTGQTGCWDEEGNSVSCAGTGQDGEVKAGDAWPAPRFTDNGNQTITDNLTGIIWAKDANVMKTRDPYFYTDGIPGDGTVSISHAQEYIQKLNNESYLGFNDWRLPNVNELRSIINYSTNSVTWLGSQGFLNLQADFYYSSTLKSADHWDCDLSSGTCYKSMLIDPRFIWPIRGELTATKIPKTGSTSCVNENGGYALCNGTGQDGELRAGITWPSPRFADNGNQTVTDGLTGLVWTRDAKTPGPSVCGPAVMKTWQEGLDYVTCLNDNNYLGYSNWRMPNMNELYSFFNAGESRLSTWLNGLGFTGVQAYGYWSSSSSGGGNSAWVLDMNDPMISDGMKWESMYVWPVRGGIVTPVNGVCSTLSGMGLPSAPTSNLCAKGVASGVAGSGPWEWSCKGVNGGEIANCSATYQTASAKTFVSTAVPMDIDDESTAISVTTVPSGACTSLFDVNVLLDITHSYVSDMGIKISHNGKMATILSEECGGSDNIAATFDSQATSTIQCPISGTFKPTDDLGVFYGDDAAGNWTLSITDYWGGDSGTLNSWSIQLKCPGSGNSGLTVTPGAGSNGSISPSTPQSVENGATASFTIVPGAGYQIVTPIGGTCPQGTLTGTSYTTGVITTDCSVTPTFSPISINGACGSSAGGKLSSAPASDLCSAGTPSSVSGPAPWSWSCSGSNGGTTADCKAYVLYADGVTVNSGATHTNKALVSLTLNAPIASKMRFSNNGTTWPTTWLTYAASYNYTVPAGDGLKTVYVQFADTGSNLLGEASDTIALDTILPTGTITINNAEMATNSRDVIIALNPQSPAQITHYRVSNTTIFPADWTVFDAGNPGIAWTLASGDGLKTVSVQFKDAAGNISAAVRDTITLDTLAPVLTVRSPVLTNLASATISGTKTAGSTVALTGPEGVTCPTNAVTAAATSWSCLAGGYAENSDTVLTFTVSDTAQNSSSATTAIIHDGLAPTAVITGTPVTPIKAGTYQLTIGGDGVTTYSWRLIKGATPGTWSLPTALATKISVASATTGDYKVEVIGRDAAGNWQDKAAATSVTWTVDAIAPATIIAGKPELRSRITTPEFSFSAEDSATFECKVDLGAYAACASPYTLPLPLKEGLHTFYVRAKDVAGNYDATPATYAWTVDTLPPILTVNQPLPTKLSTVTITGTKEAGSTVAITGPEGVTCPTTAVATATTWSCKATGYAVNNTTELTFTVTDVALNTRTATVTIVHDDAAPTGTILIKGTESTDNWTNKTTVTLNLTCEGTGTDCTQVCLSNIPTCTAWTTYADTKPWVVTTGNGTKTVYAIFRDKAGNPSIQHSDTIGLDVTIPTGKVTINSGSAFTNNRVVALAFTAADNIGGSGVAEMRYATVSTFVGADWQPYAADGEITLAGIDGVKNVYAQFRDTAGKLSLVVRDTITLDTAPPALTIGNVTPTTTTTKVITGTKALGSTIAAISVPEGVTYTLNAAAASSVTTTWSGALNNLATGTNRITATARDLAGNEAEKTASIICLANAPSGWTASGLSGQYISALAMSPADPDILYAGTFDGIVYKTTDGGTNWNQIFLEAIYPYAIAVNPKNSDVIYVATGHAGPPEENPGSGGIYKTTNGGTTWDRVLPDVYAYSMQLDPISPDKILVGTSGKGIYRSTDAGNTWTNYTAGLPLSQFGTPEDIYDIEFDKVNPLIAYVAAHNGGIYKTTNGGTTWIATGLKHGPQLRLAVAPSNRAVMYAGGDGPGGLNSPTDRIRLHKSSDAGVTWKDLSIPVAGSYGSPYTYGMVVNPANPNETYVAAAGWGVFKTSDGGTTWKQVNNGISIGVGDGGLVIHPIAPQILYLGTDNGVFKTMKGAE